jgi:hypothetical protein
MEDWTDEKKKDPIGCLGAVLFTIIAIIYAALTFGIFAP